jgi:tetrahydromethanopterin S-methyltransferase subunit G
MENKNLILGELREFRRAALERLQKLENGVESLQQAEAMRRGKHLGISFVGSIFGALITLVVTYFAR